MKALLLRLGGLGDIIVLGAVAKQLKLRGYEVHACFGSPSGDPEAWYKGTNLFEKIWIQGRSPNQIDVFIGEDGSRYSVELLKKDYDLVLDYKFSVELNSHYRHINGPGKEFFVSQNSNYVNWNDIFLGWAGIDPTTVSAEDKSPVFVLTDEERQWGKTVATRVGGTKLIAIQSFASSLVRTYYHPDRLAQEIHTSFPGQEVIFLIFDGIQWVSMTKAGVFPVKFPENMDKIRASAAIISACDLFISADSGLSHIAEALQIKSLTIYTTVPAWTRMGYYKYAKTIEPEGEVFDGVRCRPCFVLDRYCPRIRERVSKELTPREQKIKAYMDSGVPPQEAAKTLNTTMQGVLSEAEFLNKRIAALLEQSPPCTLTITPERIVEKIKEMGVFDEA